MSAVVAEMARARAAVKPPTTQELLEQARFLAHHPDTEVSLRRLLGAVLEEVNIRDKRLRKAIQYATVQRIRVEQLRRKLGRNEHG